MARAECMFTGCSDAELKYTRPLAIGKSARQAAGSERAGKAFPGPAAAAAPAARKLRRLMVMVPPVQQKHYTRLREEEQRRQGAEPSSLIAAIASRRASGSRPAIASW